MQLELVSEPVRPKPRIGDEARALVRLAIPLAAANLGQMLIGVVDTAVVGRLGELELGAAGIGNTMYFGVTIIGMGLMLGLDPLVSQAIGAGERRHALHLLWQGVWLAVAAGLPLALVILGLGAALEAMGLAPATASAARAYLIPRLPSLLPYLAFVACRSYLQAVSVTRPVVVSVVVANVLNVPLSWALVFGYEGLAIPALGIAGAAWASTVCTLAQLAVLVVAVRRESAGLEGSSWRPERDAMLRALRIGLPVGLTLLAEFGVFGLVNVLMGNIDARTLAGHQVAITLASTTFMVPVGIGAAASVRVGNAIGRGDAAGARLAGLIALGGGLAFMSLSAFAFLVFPRELSRIVTDQPDVIAAAVPLIGIAAMFQLSDGAQAVAAGALRGAGDTRFPLYANLAGHYLVGLPIGAVFGFALGRGATGLWWGLSAGLTGVALSLSLRFLRLSARPLARA